MQCQVTCLKPRFFVTILNAWLAPNWLMCFAPSIADCCQPCRSLPRGHVYFWPLWRTRYQRPSQSALGHEHIRVCQAPKCDSKNFWYYRLCWSRHLGATRSAAIFWPHGISIWSPADYVRQQQPSLQPWWWIGNMGCSNPCVYRYLVWDWKIVILL